MKKDIKPPRKISKGLFTRKTKTKQEKIDQERRKEDRRLKDHYED